MTAGGSADEVAKRSAAAADRLAQRADRARRRADAFAAGAEGERILAEALAQLAGRGWFLLPDRRTGNGGNIDMLLVGPPGVIVLDAKHWSGAVSSSGLAAGRFDRTASLRALAGIAADVRATLGQHGPPVTPILVNLRLPRTRPDGRRSIGASTSTTTCSRGRERRVAGSISTTRRAGRTHTRTWSPVSSPSRTRVLETPPESS